MLRIVETETRQQPATLDDKGKTTLSLLGIAIAHEPLRVQGLLENYGIRVSSNPGAGELVSRVLFGIEQNKRTFNYELSEILSDQLIPDFHDNFNTASFEPVNADAHESNYVAAIAGAVGSIASLFGNSQQKKLAKQQAGSQTMNAILAYKAQKEQAVMDARKQANKQGMIKAIGLVTLLGLMTTIFLVRHFKQQNNLQSP